MKYLLHAIAKMNKQINYKTNTVQKGALCYMQVIGFINKEWKVILLWYYKSYAAPLISHCYLLRLQSIRLEYRKKIVGMAR